MRLNKSKICLSIIILLTIISSYAFADDIQLPNPNNYFYVYDEAGIIDSDTANYMIETNEQLYEKTGAQIVVAVINSLQDRTEQEFANALFRQWQIGSKERNNGVLILIAPNEQRLWIEIGYGLEGALPDGRVGEIRDQQMFPHFREGDFNQGILNGFNTILSSVVNEYNLDMDISESQYYIGTESNENETTIFENIKNIFVAIGIIVLIVVDQILFKGFFTRMAFYMFLRGGFKGSSGGRNNRGGGGSSGGGGAGGGW